MCLLGKGRECRYRTLTDTVRRYCSNKSGCERQISASAGVSKLGSYLLSCSLRIEPAARALLAQSRFIPLRSTCLGIQLREYLRAHPAYTENITSLIAALSSQSASACDPDCHQLNLRVFWIKVLHRSCFCVILPPIMPDTRVKWCTLIRGIGTCASET